MPEQALGVVSVLAAYFPRVRLPDETRTAWAAALVEHDAVDALAAVNELGRSSKFLPALAELLEGCRMARRDRFAHPSERILPAEALVAGVTFAEWLRDHATPEQRRAVGRVFPTLAAKYGVTAELLDMARPPLFDRDDGVAP